MLLMAGEVRRLRIEQPPVEGEMTPAWIAEEQMKELAGEGECVVSVRGVEPEVRERERRTLLDRWVRSRILLLR